MRLIALLLAAGNPAIAADRMAVPSRATPANLQSTLEACQKATPKGDRCFAVQVTLARMLLDSAPDRSLELAEQARLGVIDATDTMADTLDPLRFRQAQLTAAEKTQLVQGEERTRRYWLEVADAAELIGDAAIAAGRGWSAGERFENARILREAHGRNETDRRALLRVTGKTALLESLTGSSEKAFAKATSTLASARAELGPADALTLRLTLDTADIASRLSRSTEAEQLYEMVRAGRPTATATEQIELDARYARHLVAADRLVEAEHLFRVVLDRLMAGNAGDLRIATGYLDLARTLLPARAIIMVEQAIAIRRARFGENHIETARAMLALARLYEQADRVEQAEPLRLKGTGLLVGSLSYTNFEAAMATLEYGEMLLALHKLIPAQSALSTAQRSLRTLVGETHPAVGRAMLLLSAAALRQGQPDALERMERAVAVVRAGRTPTQYDRIEAEAGLAYATLRFGGNPVRAYQVIRPVGVAALERSLAYRDFGPAAQREMRRLSGIYNVQVEAAWAAAQRR